MQRSFETAGCYFDLDSTTNVVGMQGDDELKVYLRGVPQPITFDNKRDADAMRTFFREHLPLFATLSGSTPKIVIRVASEKNPKAEPEATHAPPPPETGRSTPD